MAKYLTNLLLDTYTALGRAEEPFLATGGTTTTIVNSLIQYLDEQPDESDFTERRYWAFVAWDAGGAGAAPEGEYQRISAYASDTWTYTMATMGATPAAGDRVVVVSEDDLPMQQAIILANQVLQDFGEIELVDTSLTTVAQQTEYTLPAGITRENLIEVMIQGITTDADDNRWVRIQYKDIQPATAGTQHTIVIDQYSAGYDLLLRYKSYHPVLSVYNSEIEAALPYQTIKAAMRAICVDWMNNNLEGLNDYWVAQDRKSAALLTLAKAEHPMPRARLKNKLTTLGLGYNDEDPGIPDPIS